jgi:hypothetical protein
MLGDDSEDLTAGSTREQRKGFKVRVVVVRVLCRVQEKRAKGLGDEDQVGESWSLVNDVL